MKVYVVTYYQDEAFDDNGHRTADVLCVKADAETLAVYADRVDAEHRADVLQGYYPSCTYQVTEVWL
jgi:hypothetical protein